jgi:hypothetical protein
MKTGKPCTIGFVINALAITASVALTSNGRESGRDMITFAEARLTRARLLRLPRIEPRTAYKSPGTNITGKSAGITPSAGRKD